MRCGDVSILITMHSRLAEYIWCKGLDSHAHIWWKKARFKPLSPTFKCSLATFAIWAIAAISSFTDASVSQVIYPLKDIPGFCSADAATPSRPGKGVEEGAILCETQTKWKHSAKTWAMERWHHIQESFKLAQLSRGWSLIRLNRPWEQQREGSF